MLLLSPCSPPVRPGPLPDHPRALCLPSCYAALLANVLLAKLLYNFRMPTFNINYSPLEKKPPRLEDGTVESPWEKKSMKPSPSCSPCGSISGDGELGWARGGGRVLRRE